MNPSIIISQATRLSDLQALLDTYSLEIRISAGVVLCVPLFYLDAWPWQSRPPFHSPIKIETPCPISMTLLRCPPTMDTEFIDAAPTCHRWPFYVDGELTMTIDTTSHSYTQTFRPGGTYEEIKLDEQPTAIQ